MSHSEQSEAESKRWERSALSASEEVLLGCDRVLLERISPNKAKTARGTQAPLLFSAVFEEIHSESTSSLRSGRFGRGLPQDDYDSRIGGQIGASPADDVSCPVARWEKQPQIFSLTGDLAEREQR